MKREEWLDGIRGIACLIVMLGHNVAVIVPALFFGRGYETDRSWEYAFQASPLRLLYYGPAMVPIFFVISGILLSHSVEKSRYIDIVIRRYIRFFPMVAIAVLITGTIMKLGAVYSVPLIEFSKSEWYAGAYNTFTPSFKGMIFDAAVKTFIKDSAYVNPLWYLGTEFIGTMVIALVGRLLLKAKQQFIKICVWSVLIAVCVFLESYTWKAAYIVAMILGFAFAGKRWGDKLPRWSRKIIICICLLALSGTSWLEKLHISFSGVWVQILSAYVLLVMLANETKIKSFLSIRQFKWLGKHSFAIYAIHWPFVISIASGISLVLAKKADYAMAAGIGITVGCITTIVLAPFVDVLYKRIYHFIMNMYDNVRNVFRDKQNK